MSVFCGPPDAKASADSARPVLALAGPTGSGKSELALILAERLGATIVNADALQVYRGLRILTARPDAAAEARAPHRLYGVLPPSERCSAGRWRALALAEIASIRAAGRLPLLVGGTGLYLEALEQGLAPVPHLPPEAPAEAERLLLALGPGGLHARLAAVDPETAAALQPGDRQRLLRAWAVLSATGEGLAAWRRRPATDPLPLRWLVLLPPRDWLRERAALRFGAMLAAGALQEVQALLALGLPPDLPVMKAVGVRELAAVLAGACSLAEAETAAVAATRQYLKRQATWLRGRLLSRRSDVVLWSEQFSNSATEWFVTKVQESA